jgi:hypothetical protein
VCEVSGRPGEGRRSCRLIQPCWPRRDDPPRVSANTVEAYALQSDEEHAEVNSRPVGPHHGMTAALAERATTSSMTRLLRATLRAVRAVRLRGACPAAVHRGSRPCQQSIPASYPRLQDAVRNARPETKAEASNAARSSIAVMNNGCTTRHTRFDEAGQHRRRKILSSVWASTRAAMHGGGPSRSAVEWTGSSSEPAAARQACGRDHRGDSASARGEAPCRWAATDPTTTVNMLLCKQSSRPLTLPS